MPFWYFLKTPKLPPELDHQSGSVEVRQYVIREGRPVSAGTPIVLVENYWAIMQFDAVGKGIFRRAFFEKGMAVKIGDPLGIVAADGDDLVYGKENLTVSLVKVKRVRPSELEAGRQVMRKYEEALRRLAE